MRVSSASQYSASTVLLLFTVFQWLLSDVVCWHLSLNWMSSPALIFFAGVSFLCVPELWKIDGCLCNVLVMEHSVLALTRGPFSQLDPVPQTAGVTPSSLNTHILGHYIVSVNTDKLFPHKTLASFLKTNQNVESEKKKHNFFSDIISQECLMFTILRALYSTQRSR